MLNSIANELERTIKNKADIKSAIEAREVEVPDNTIFGNYPEKIRAIIDKYYIDYNNYDEYLYCLVTRYGYDMSNLFRYRDDFEYNIINELNTSQITNMNYMFAESAMTKLNLSNWDVGNVTNMASMFYLCDTLTTVGDISNWNTSQATDMGYMFYGCKSLTTIDLSNWNVSNVNLMDHMFHGCSSLTTVNLSNWHFDKDNYEDTYICNMMFSGCNNLTKLRLDNCDADTLATIIVHSSIPNVRNGTIYCKESEALKILVEWPSGWNISFV